MEDENTIQSLTMDGSATDSGMLPQSNVVVLRYTITASLDLWSVRGRNGKQKIPDWPSVAALYVIPRVWLRSGENQHVVTEGFHRQTSLPLV